LGNSYQNNSLMTWYGGRHSNRFKDLLHLRLKLLIFSYHAHPQISAVCTASRLTNEHNLLSLTDKVLTTCQPDYRHNLISVLSTWRTRFSSVATL